MRLVIVAGSLRPGSLNRRFGGHVASLLGEAGHTVTVFSGEDLRLPLYEEGLPVPEAVSRMRAALLEAEGLVIVSPEYNAGIPGHLKNAVDWLSTLTPSPWKELPVQLAACSPGAFGGARALMAWRPTLANMGALALPQVITIPAADHNLDASGAPTEARSAKAVREALDSFCRIAARFGR